MAEEAERRSSLEEEFDMSEAHVNFIDAIKRGDVAAIDNLIAADVRLQPNLAGTGAGGNGKEVVMGKLEDIAAKAKNSVAAVDPVRVMRCGNQTRSIFTIKKSVVTVRVGTAITWVGGRAVLIVMDKGTNETFYVDNTEAAASAPEANDGDEVKEEEDEPEVQERRRSIFSAADVLSQQFQPPFLVPRPEQFPPPSLRVHVVGCKRLKTIAALPRPMNSYVRVRLGKVVQQTEIIRSDKSPRYSTSRFMYEVPVDEADNARLIIEVWDSNIGVDDLISMFEIPLSAIPAANPDTMSELHWTCRLKVRKHRLSSRRVHKFDLLSADEVKETTDPVIMLGLQKQDMKMWWSIQEARARDAQAEREIQQARNAKNGGEKVAPEDLFDPEEYDGHQEQCSIM